MGIKTDIPWCDSTVNLLVGCDGCELSGGHCYAEALVGRWAGKKGWPKAFHLPELFPHRLEAALNWSDLTGKARPDKPRLDGHPRTIFVNDLSDPFTESIDLTVWGKVIEKMQWSPHRWLWLTKRPQRFAEFVDWWQRQYTERFPRNIWGGVSVTSQATLVRARELAMVDVAVRFISAEPLLGPLDLQPAWQDDECPASFLCDLLIVGGESGPGARPFDVQWARDLRDQCKECGTAFFFKQAGANPHMRQDTIEERRRGEGPEKEWPLWTRFGTTPGWKGTEWQGRRAFLIDPKGGDLSELPEDLRVREMPKS